MPGFLDLLQMAQADGGGAGGFDGLNLTGPGGSFAPPPPMAPDPGMELAAPPQMEQPGLLSGMEPGAGGEQFKPQGFLERLGGQLGEEDSRGRTFGDKLYAAGDIAMGNDPTAFLQNRQTVADKARQAQEAKQMKAKAQQILAENMGPQGLNAQGYMKGMAGIGEGVDLENAIKLQEMNAPKYQQFSRQGGYDIRDIKNPSAPPVASYDAQRKLSAGQRYNPDTGEPELDPLWIESLRQKADISGAAQERYRAPPRPRAGAAAGVKGPTATGRRIK